MIKIYALKKEMFQQYPFGLIVIIVTLVNTTLDNVDAGVREKTMKRFWRPKNLGHLLGMMQVMYPAECSYRECSKITV
jgi:hypothetical protein